MATPLVTVVMASTTPVSNEVLGSIRSYLDSTGFEFEILTFAGEPFSPQHRIVSVENPSYGALLRRAAAECRGEVVVFIDGPVPPQIAAIGDAVAMIRSGTADIVFGELDGRNTPPAILRMLLVDLLPDPRAHFKAFSSSAVGLVIGESKLDGVACDLEIGYLANKYGFRVEWIHLPDFKSPRRSYGLGELWAATRIRLLNRNMGYRAARRCPVCFSSNVWSIAQIPGNLVRACNRCKCRYLNQFSEEEDAHPVRRVMRPHPPQSEISDETHSRNAREKTALRRLNVLRKQLPPRARILEVGIRDSSFGRIAAQHFEYVGIDPSTPAIRHARAKGLDVYCATLASFVNTGPLFDAVTMDHVLESIPDPHDALSRIRELVKPDGLLVLTTFDTEGLTYLLTEKELMAQNFRRHLVLYSRSALIELLERSGFDIDSAAPEFEYRDHVYLRQSVAARWKSMHGAAEGVLKILPDPLITTSGSIRVIARRRSGPPISVRTIRAVEPTHAR